MGELELDPAFQAAADAVQSATVTHLEGLASVDLQELQGIVETLLDFAYEVRHDPTFGMTVAEQEAYEADHSE